MADRRKLRGQLKCQSFKWYLDSVLPQLKPLSGDDFVYGRIRQGRDDCMDIALGHVPVMASLSPCSEDKNSQVGSCTVYRIVFARVSFSFNSSHLSVGEYKTELYLKKILIY